MAGLPRGLCVLALLALMHGPARAESRSCKFVEWGYSYIKVERDGKIVMYLLELAGSKWRNVPYGRHGPGYLVCEQCSPNGISAGGLYHFLVQEHVVSNSTYKHPTNLAERVTRRSETWGYP